MKNLLKNTLLQAVLVILGILFIFQYVIAPGLTAASSITNIISVLLSVFIIFGLFKYLNSIKGSGLIDMDELKEAEQLLKEKELGETELDYVPKPKAKRKPKTTKSEYPLPPHHTIVNTSKTEKVLGEFQINNKEKVRKSIIKKTK